MWDDCEEKLASRFDLVTSSQISELASSYALITSAIKLAIKLTIKLKT